MKVLSAVLGITLIVGMAGCSTSDQRQAREQARETGHEISDEAKKAGHEIKRDFPHVQSHEGHKIIDAQQFEGLHCDICGWEGSLPGSKRANLWEIEESEEKS